jgi:alkylation response protein AidB-like acyl-CoA dehydrogenase
MTVETGSARNQAVTFAPSAEDEPGELVTVALSAAAPASVPNALVLAVLLGNALVTPGGGRTRELWEALATVAAIDLGAARAIEPHLDAVAILKQAGQAALVGDGTWGVFAAEGPAATLRYNGWTLDGTKPWCSLAGSLDSALVTAPTEDGSRALFAVDLRASGITVEPGAWHARGLTEIPSGPVQFSGVSAIAVGDADWYLTRPGFAWGGIGVAACWFGGAVGIARTVFSQARATEPLAMMHLGAIDETIQSARRALNEAASLIDSGVASGEAGRLLAKRVRATVARACEEVISRAGRALGPAPLALDGEHAKRVADLELYVRQHHAEKDDSSLGLSLSKAGDLPW